MAEGESAPMGENVQPMGTGGPVRKYVATTVAGGDPLAEIGTTGLRQFGGFVLEEWLVQLQGRRAAWAYREMLDNDPVVGAILFAIEMLARGVSYRVEGGDAERAEFIEQNMNDMSMSWLDFISEALAMLPYGWSFHEIVYKRRLGPQERPPRNLDLIDSQVTVQAATQEDTGFELADSEFNDGKIGWRKLPSRAQETLLRWLFDSYSGLAGMEQVDWHGGRHRIPIEKAVLFRTKTTRKNPEGRSILRNSWTSYYRMTNIQQIEAIGIERDLAGIPVATPPEGVDLYSDSNKKLLAVVQEMVTGIRRDENEGVVLPQHGWELELLTTGGARQIDTDQIVRRYEQRIASSMLADFVLLGQDAMGSFAMVDIKSELFGVAIDTVLDIICNTMNEHAIPRLLKLNGMKTEDPPRITHSAAGRIDLEKVGHFLQSVALAGGPIPWSRELIEEMFREAGLPAVFEGDGALETTLHSTGETHPEEGDTTSKGAKEQKDGVRATGAQNDARARNEAKPIKKGDQGNRSGVAMALGDRAKLLSSQLEAEIQGALRDLGIEASTAYLHEAPRNRNAQAAAKKVLNRLNVKGWVETRIAPLLRNHAGRVAMDTQRTLSRELEKELRLTEDTMRDVMAAAGKNFKASDLEPQVHEAVVRAIIQGMEESAQPTSIADRIRTEVPQGRFRGAGVTGRAQLIARNETANVQRAATLGLYQSSPDIKEVEVRDGIYGPPRSDAACMDRDGERVPIEDAARVVPYHPLCTLGFDPVVA